MPQQSIAWRAASDQIAHAYLAGRKRARSTVCGIRLVDERLAWPPVAKCPDCWSAIGQKGVAA